jgi:hypothetical protein
LRWVSEEIAFPQGKRTGISTYAINLIKNLANINPSNRYILFISKDVTLNPALAALQADSGCLEFVEVPKWWRWSVRPDMINRAANAVTEKVITIPLVKRQCLDIFHSVQQGTPPFRIQNCQSVVTVHDLTYLIFAKTIRKRRYLRWLDRLRFSKIGQSTILIADSENTKRDMIRLLGIDHSKIRVIYLGVGREFSPVDNPSLIQEIKTKYKIDHDYILHVGGISPTKNMRAIMQAFRELISSYKRDIQLVLAGDFSRSPYLGDFKRGVKDLNLENNVVLPGNIDNGELSLFYGGAALFVYPSLYEGFGLPILEAMACGCPVVTSNTSSMPEVAGGAGLMIDPRDVAELASAMHKILVNDELRRKMKVNGIERAKRFSWEKTSRETLKVYQEAVGGSSTGNHG